MKLKELLSDVKANWKGGPGDVDIKGIAYNSNKIEEGFLFVAISGFFADGHDYIEEAIHRGAAAVVSEKGVESTGAGAVVIQNNTTCVEVPDSREALAIISAAYYGRPSESLSLIGITGTNGKTTTGYIVRHILNTGGKKTGLLGTINYMTGDNIMPAVNTTPESLDLQRYLRDMVNNNMEYAVVEVSSHALELRRVEGCSFKTAAFTNFSQDHLDFHGSMDAYFDAKCKLFGYMDTGGTAVLNWDDPMIRPLAGKLDCNVVTCGCEEGATIRAVHIADQGTQLPFKTRRDKTLDNSPTIPSGLSMKVQTPDSTFELESPLVSRFNLYNILMSVGIAYSLRIPDSVIQQGVRGVDPVEGRFERIEEGQDFLCIVDYAHTEDALRTLINEARRMTTGRVITVFGCGGNRDKGKRPRMGASASALSDMVIVTSDNPRYEDPMEIINDILRGTTKNNYTVQPDRELAIKEAVSLAQKGDVLLVAGKGHEAFQERKGRQYHFSDKEVLREGIKDLRQRKTKERRNGTK